MPPMPPSWMPIDAKLAKPVSANVTSSCDRGLNCSLILPNSTYATNSLAASLIPSRRSEEHTSEPSHLGISYAVFCLKKKKKKKKVCSLLLKKKQKKQKTHHNYTRHH